MVTVLRKTGLGALLESYGVDPLAFALSLTKAESDFNPNSASSANAYGLMQLLVPTAKGVLARHRNEYREIMLAAGKRPLSTAELNGRTLRSDWQTNMVLGALYLKEHVEEFSQRLSGLRTSLENKGKLLINMIAGGYNAGEGAVRKYLRRLSSRGVSLAQIDPSKSIVPYNETRGYLANIQRYYRNWSRWIDSRMSAAGRDPDYPEIWGA